MRLDQALKRAAHQHRQHTLQLIRGSDESLIVVIPNTRTTLSGASMFGDLAASSGTPIEKGPFKCLWMDAMSVLRGDPTVPLPIVGKYQSATAFVTVALEDVLITPGETYQETWFDKGTHVVHRGQKYEILGTERDGLANVEPYILMVALAGEVRRRA